METINHEYYVSFEVANLLKEAGFDWECNHYYFTQNGKTEVKSDFRHPAQNYNESMATMDSKSFEFEVCSCPTLDVAQRWLREVKGICLTIQPLFDKVNGQFNVVVGFTPFIHRMDGEMIIVSLDSEHTYEEAQESGIKKTLEIILEKGE